MVDRFFAHGHSWLTRADSQDVVISSRVRLARNLAAYPFPERCTPENRKEIWDNLKTVFLGLPELEKAIAVEMTELSALDKLFLLERHLISRDLMDTGEGGGLVAVPDGRLSVMINEEDHIRLQVVLPGLDLTSAWEAANRLDDGIEASVSYAFSSRLGYLTACPSNVGTGMRTSVMLHLPGLVLSQEMEPIVRGLTKIGLTVRGLLGEGSEAVGNIFQISNQVTLGEGETEIVTNLAQIVQEVVEHELNARARLWQKKPVILHDHILRAYGVLSHALLLTTKEALDFLSSLRLGVMLGILDGAEIEDLRKLMEQCQPAHLQKTVGRRLNSRERDFERARLVREVLRPEEAGGAVDGEGK